MTSTASLIAAVKDRLEDDLPARVSAEGLPAVVEVLKYRPEVAPIAKTPFLWVSMDRANRSDDPALGVSLKSYAHVRGVQVGIMVAAKDPETVELYLQTYADLVRVSLETDSGENGGTNLGGWVNYIEWQETDYRASFRENSILYQEALLSFEMPSVILRGTEG